MSDPSSKHSKWVDAARSAMEIEAEAIRLAATRLDGGLTRAVELILAHPGKVVATGMGKSGHVARKIVATLCSTGTPAVFLHPAEAVHGDLGVYTAGDPTIMLSKSGTTAELLRLVPVLREFHSPVIGILGNPSGPLGREMDVLLDASVLREADPNNLAPTASAAVAAALGDALAVALIEARSFTPEEFGRYHPAGQLGRNLRLRVCDVMHSGDEVAWVDAGDSVKQVVIAMTRRPLGAACVGAAGKKLDGLITDGDLRRALQKHDDIRSLRARDIMTARPVTVGAQASLLEALELMEGRPSQISLLAVVEPVTGACLGLIRLHDIYQAAPHTVPRP